MVIIILLVLEFEMLHTKFQGNRPRSSGEEDCFFKFLPYMDMKVILVM